MKKNVNRIKKILIRNLFAFVKQGTLFLITLSLTLLALLVTACNPLAKLENKLDDYLNTVTSNISPVTSSDLTRITMRQAFKVGDSSYLAFVFTEDVQDFTLSDITIDPDASLSKDAFITNTPKNYVLKVTPKKQGEIKLSIPVGAIKDTSGKKISGYTAIFTILPENTTIYNIYFVPNGGEFIVPQFTNLRVKSNSIIDRIALEPDKILSYVTRSFVEWRNNGGKYVRTAPTTDMTLEAIWSNSCGKEETFHPTTKAELKTHIDQAIGDSPTADLNHIDTSALTDMQELFKDKSTFNGNISCWNTANVKNMNKMFYNAKAFNQDLSEWSVGAVTNSTDIFKNSAMEEEENKQPKFKQN